MLAKLPYSTKKKKTVKKNATQKEDFFDSKKEIDKKKLFKKSIKTWKEKKHFISIEKIYIYLKILLIYKNKKEKKHFNILFAEKKIE